MVQSPAVRQMYEKYIRFLVEVLTTEDHSAKIPVEKVARDLVFSLLGLKCAAKNVKHMKTLAEPQVDVVLATLIPTG